ncbi:hypothetical protein BD779DRAFT_66281 [Infundibulicybe gibba]|nr:hypothetical protein BD779DRAFT_66281 [Infundibulicybe gibba]
MTLSIFKTTLAICNHPCASTRLYVTLALVIPTTFHFSIGSPSTHSRSSASPCPSVTRQTSRLPVRSFAPSVRTSAPLISPSAPMLLLPTRFFASTSACTPSASPYHLMTFNLVYTSPSFYSAPTTPHFAVSPYASPSITKVSKTRTGVSLMPRSPAMRPLSSAST